MDFSVVFALRTKRSFEGQLKWKFHALDESASTTAAAPSTNNTGTAVDILRLYAEKDVGKTRKTSSQKKRAPSGTRLLKKTIHVVQQATLTAGGRSQLFSSNQAWNIKISHR
ncbi:hypothetical protein ACIQSO_02000 [Pseudomonas putida]|uniref:hypothetical protein n=1 Tax=Pseudomonas putida TaxID=303 RepID=UPI00383B7AAA